MFVEQHMYNIYVTVKISLLKRNYKGDGNLFYSGLKGTFKFLNCYIYSKDDIKKN